jgi:hypothetical protein
MCSRSSGGVATIAAGLDSLATEDLLAVPGPGLLDRSAALMAQRNRLDAEIARTVRRAELGLAPESDGMRSMAAWLRGHCRLSVATAAQLVRNGRALEQLPAVAAAHADGTVTADQVNVVSDVVKPINLGRAHAQGVDLAGVDEALADIAAERSHEVLAKTVHHYLQRLDDDGPEPDPTEQRQLTLSKHGDGTVSLRGQLDAVGGEKVSAVLESMVQADRPGGDTRTRAQRLGDALVQWADNTLAHGDLPTLRTIRPQAVVTIGLADAADPATGKATAELGFGALVSAAAARQLTCDADLTRIVLDPDGLPLDVGRTQRLVPPHLRKAVEHRDRQCVFAGCDAPTHWCEVHHVLAWLLGGATSLDNSALLCERHHTQVHHGFRIQRDTAGRWHTYRPDGTEILVIRSTTAGESARARAG